MCLLLGIPRALAMASVSKDGSRAIRAPWIPLPWRLSAYSWKAQHKGSGEKSSQTWSTDWGYWKLRTGSISHHGSSKTLFSHSSMYIQVPPPPILTTLARQPKQQSYHYFCGSLVVVVSGCNLAQKSPQQRGIPSLTSHPPWGLCLWSTSLLCDMSKQWGPGLGSHIWPAVPAGPANNTTHR